MAKKQEWTVRVINWKTERGKRLTLGTNEIPGLWVEQLRYMGFAKELADFEDRNVIEFYAPRGSDSHVWADQNAARMRSFGIDAAAAPIWRDDMYGRQSTQTNDSSHMERLNRPKQGLSDGKQTT